MKKNILLLCTIGLLAACDTDKIENLAFDVVPQTLQVKVGETVNFDIVGNPNYIVFYSGENGSKYEMKDVTSREIEQMSLCFNSKLSYYGSTPKECINEGLKVYIATDFDGDYTKEGIERAKHNGVFQPLDFDLPDQTTNNKDVASGILNFEQYETFYIAFKYEYHIPDNLKSFSTGLYSINNFNLTSVVQGEDDPIIKKSPKSDLGFTLIPVQGPSNLTDGAIWNVQGVQMRVEADKLHMRAGTVIRDSEYWFVSKPISAANVEMLTSGVAIKGLSAALNSYTYKYSKAGVYTATFVARNANAWNTDEEIKEFTINVEE